MQQKVGQCCECRHWRVEFITRQRVAPCSIERKVSIFRHSEDMSAEKTKVRKRWVNLMTSATDGCYSFKPTKVLEKEIV